MMDAVDKGIDLPGNEVFQDLLENDISIRNQWKKNKRKAARKRAQDLKEIIFKEQIKISAER